MALTTWKVEKVLVRRLGNMLAIVGLDEEFENPNLADPMASALRSLGYTVAEIDEVTDADLLPVTTAHIDAFLDLAELRMLESVETNFVKVTSTVGPVTERWGELMTKLGDLIKRKREVIDERYVTLSADYRLVRMRAL